RFVPTTNVYINRFDSYTVVTTYARSTGGDKRTPEQERSSSAELRIDGAQPKAMHVTAETAILYLKEMRANVTDSAIRKNADLAISKLSAYR
ncbi:MAG: hypothetical protein ACREBQ_14660, partial [Nitrososphaerales archaeon]